MSGLFIVFDGTDGSGKTTMVERAVAYLRNKGLIVVQTKDPGGSQVGAGIRRLMFKEFKTQDMKPGVVDLLFLTSHLQNWLEVVQPALQAEATVISDRWYTSAFAYMSQREVPPPIRTVYDQMHGDPPDLQIILYGDPQKLTERARARTTESHQTKKAWNDPRVLLLVQDNYFTQCLNSPNFYPICVDNKSVDAVWEEVKDAIDLAFARRRLMAKVNAVQEMRNKYALAS